MKTVLVYGSGRLGIQISRLVTAHFPDTIKLAGFIDDTKPGGVDVVEGLKTLGSLQEVADNPDFAPNRVSIIFAIGYSDMVGRMGAYSKVLEAGYDLLSIVHPRAIVEPNAEIGGGTIVQASAVIDNSTRIGGGCFIDIGVLVSEFCQIGDNNFIAAGTAIGGYTSIGNSNFIGMNCTIVDNLTVGDTNHINAQTLVYRGLADDTTLVEFHERHELKKG